MTNHKEALAKLLTKVEAGDAAYGDFRCLEVPMQDMSYTQIPNEARMAYKGSLDAAKALHDTVLPGWRLEEAHRKWGGDWYVNLERKSDLAICTSISIDPARAWLVAILKALIAQED